MSASDDDGTSDEASEGGQADYEIPEQLTEEHLSYSCSNNDDCVLLLPQSCCPFTTCSTVPKVGNLDDYDLVYDWLVTYCEDPTGFDTDCPNLSPPRCSCVRLVDYRSDCINNSCELVTTINCDNICFYYEINNISIGIGKW